MKNLIFIFILFIFALSSNAQEVTQELFQEGQVINEDFAINRQPDKVMWVTFTNSVGREYELAAIFVVWREDRYLRLTADSVPEGYPTFLFTLVGSPKFNYSIKIDD